MSNKNKDRKQVQTEGRSKLRNWDAIYTGQVTDHVPPDPQILSFLENINEGKALDVGCGAGGLCIALAKRGWKTTGIDITPKAISAGRKAAQEYKVDTTFILNDASTWQPNDTYDLITCNFGVPPEVEKRHNIYAMISQAVKPGGVVLFVIGKHENRSVSEGFLGYESLNIEELKLAFNGFDILKSVEIKLDGHKHGGKIIENGKKPAFIFMASRPHED